MVETFFGEAGPIGLSLSGQLPPDGPTMADIVVQPLSASQWRVCDRRVPDRDARSLLGFIEKKAERYEVMQLGHGFEWFYFTSLTAATAHFASASVGTAGSARTSVARE